jgi:hypothetical protein
MTELETQFVVSEMLERIPSLRVVASDGRATSGAIAAREAAE